jgi:hypothetical protein
MSLLKIIGRVFSAFVGKRSMTRDEIPFTGERDGIYYENGIPFNGDKSMPGREIHAIREPYGYSTERVVLHYKDGKVVSEESFWDHVR